MCYEYTDLLEKQEREIFQRVQLGAALTPGEKLQALSSPRADFIRDVVGKYLDVQTGLGELLKLNTDRARPFQTIAQLLYSIHLQLYEPPLSKSTSPSKKKTIKAGGVSTAGHPVLTKFLVESQEPVEPPLHSTFQMTMTIFLGLARHPEYKSCFNIREKDVLSPIEFIMSGYLIWKNMKQATVEELSRGISQMRLTARREHADLRTNSKCFKTFNDLVDSFGRSLPSSNPNPNGVQGVLGLPPPMRIPAADDEAFLRPIKELLKQKRDTSKKRKRDDTEDEEDINDETLGANKVPRNEESEEVNVDEPPIATLSKGKKPASKGTPSKHVHFTSPIRPAAPEASTSTSTPSSRIPPVPPPSFASQAQPNGRPPPISDRMETDSEFDSFFDTQHPTSSQIPETPSQLSTSQPPSSTPLPSSLPSSAVHRFTQEIKELRSQGVPEDEIQFTLSQRITNYQAAGEIIRKANLKDQDQDEPVHNPDSFYANEEERQMKLKSEPDLEAGEWDGFATWSAKKGKERRATRAQDSAQVADSSTHAQSQDPPIIAPVQQTSVWAPNRAPISTPVATLSNLQPSTPQTNSRPPVPPVFEASVFTSQAPPSLRTSAGPSQSPTRQSAPSPTRSTLTENPNAPVRALMYTGAVPSTVPSRTDNRQGFRQAMAASNAAAVNGSAGVERRTPTRGPVAVAVPTNQPIRGPNPLTSTQHPSASPRAQINNMPMTHPAPVSRISAQPQSSTTQPQHQPSPSSPLTPLQQTPHPLAMPTSGAPNAAQLALAKLTNKESLTLEELHLLRNHPSISLQPSFRK
ncbi:hypothetical protein SISSUDRAFT_729616 [Sistotremastrum suecicum HHB10207 ss-3]|uniref:Uncharacterized protein n=1 Tax=Sistotremastrum suecicum HHB10207 ss-3 TaxID=1314776 RepID=A0A166DHV3_9AGAM|nr:hypothetical protein SISSUDRAFT_729616 [Sistotremastrum suecicum HHB10207 ss-3]